ncbi:MAG TPA: YfiR family protein [Gallionella sp.]|nr:YfiR family protein [Gallionella sp.]
MAAIAHFFRSLLRVRLLSHAGLWAVIGMVLFVPGMGVADGLVTANANKVEAAFLRNFARYVTWPPQTFADERAPWKICILGSDRFDDVLENTLLGRKEQGRAFEISRAQTLEQLPSCQIIFIGYKDAGKRRAALDRLMARPVLTVGDAPDFLQDGGIIRFQVEEHVEIGINLDQARAVALKIPTKMLEIAREVKENGAVRIWR